MILGSCNFPNIAASLCIKHKVAAIFAVAINRPYCGLPEPYADQSLHNNEIRALYSAWAKRKGR